MLDILFLCLKTRVKMLVFDRPSTFPLTLVLLSNSPLYIASSSILIQMHNCLECLGLSLAEYARYSRLLYFPFSLCLIGRCSRRWSPGARVPRRRLLLLRRDHRRPGPGVVSEVPRQEACAFSIAVAFVLALLGHVCDLVSVLRYYCFRWHLYVSSWYIFELSWPLACIIQLVLFTLLELCCDIPPWHPDLDHVPCVYDYCTWS